MTNAEIAATLRYCDAHCDNQDEVAIVHWVAEKFAEALYKHPTNWAEFMSHATIEVSA